MHAEHGYLDAAIGFALAAGMAGSAGEIGIDDADISSCESGAGRRSNNFDCQFMAHHARILEKWMFALKDVIVRAANADAPGLHQRLTGLQLWDGPLFNAQLAGGRANESINGIHEGDLPLNGI